MNSTQKDSTQDKGMNREQWLEAAVNELRPVFKNAGFTIPPRMYVSVGWPSSGGTKRKNTTIGQAWSPENSADKVGHIFISPVLDNVVDVLATLVHEVGHIVVGLKHGHKAPFVRFCKAIGLEGKPTATYAGDDLVKTLDALVEKIGDYPHAKLAPSERKVQGTRLLKVQCPDCGYTIRVTRKWLDEGVPTCPCGALMSEDIDGLEPDTLLTAQTTIEYSAHNERFTIIYSKKATPQGRILSQRWLVTDWQAIVTATAKHPVSGDDTPVTYAEKVTVLPTRDDVIGFMHAVLEGVYKYDDTEIIDSIDAPDTGEEGDDFLLPDEPETRDFTDEDDDELARKIEQELRENNPKWDDDRVYAEVNKRLTDHYPKPPVVEPIELAPDADPQPF
jgi:hypothetical protein